MRDNYVIWLLELLKIKIVIQKRGGKYETIISFLIIHIKRFVKSLLNVYKAF